MTSRTSFVGSSGFFVKKYSPRRHSAASLQPKDSFHHEGHEEHEVKKFRNINVRNLRVLRGERHPGDSARVSTRKPEASFFKGLQMLLGMFSLLCSGYAAGAAELTLTGVVRAQEEVVVRSESGGIVQRIAVREGERVREGQVLVELKNDRQKIALELTRARLGKAQALLAETKVLLDNAKKEHARVKIAGDALPRKELDDKGDQVLRLEALLQAQEAEVKQAKEEVNLRAIELKETQLLAPFSGAVTEIYIHRGDTLRPMDTQVLEIVDLDRLFAELLLPVSHLHRIRLDHRVKIRVESDASGRPAVLEGRVIHVNPKVDAASRTFRVKVAVPGDGRIRPGMTAQISFGS